MSSRRSRFTAVSVYLALLTVLFPTGDLSGEVFIHPFETDDARPVPANTVDTHVLALLREKQLGPAFPCSDEVFVRRAYLDIIGTLPEPHEVTAFLDDRRPDKRAVLVDTLLERPEFADYWSLKWCDLLRVKAEFPINLWPNAVQAYHRWIRTALRENHPWNRFAREILTAGGSNFYHPPVNFYRALAGEGPEAVAEAVALTWMGVRLNPQDNAWAGMPTFFSRVAYKHTAEWKEEIVYFDPVNSETLETFFPDGTRVTIPPDTDPRVVFADWLVQPGNPWFARNIVNRIWYWLMGRGIIHEPDDIRPDNPAVNPPLLNFLEEELVRSGYDLRHIYRLILNSRTYQQSSRPRVEQPSAKWYGACYPVRRLEAEVLADALGKITGTGNKYTSFIPEPFTFVPEQQRSILLSDGSITGPFLELFGRPARDTGRESERNNQVTDRQLLYLMNSTDLQRRIEQSPRLRAIIRRAGGDHDAVVRQVYLLVMSRPPTPEELQTAARYFETGGLTPPQATADLTWALVNSREFLYRH